MMADGSNPVREIFLAAIECRVSETGNHPWVAMQAAFFCPALRLERSYRR
jgi:hypothetical protein